MSVGAKIFSDAPERNILLLYQVDGELSRAAAGVYTKLNRSQSTCCIFPVYLLDTVVLAIGVQYILVYTVYTYETALAGFLSTTDHDRLIRLQETNTRKI